MAPYTKTGDGGLTHLPGQAKTMVRKDDVRCAALGTLDELNAAVGLCLSEAARSGSDAVGKGLSPIQGELLAAGSVLGAVCTGTKPPVELEASATRRLEQEIDPKENGQLGHPQHASQGRTNELLQYHRNQRPQKPAQQRNLGELGPCPAPDGADASWFCRPCVAFHCHIPLQ